MFYSSLFAKNELLISEEKLGMLLLGVQLIAFPITLLAGRIANRKEIGVVIRWGLVVWFFVLIGLFFSTSFSHLVGVMVLTALVIGSTQSLLRAHAAGIIDRSVSAEGFGFFGVANKSAALFAPAFVALIVQVIPNPANHCTKGVENFFLYEDERSEVYLDIQSFSKRVSEKMFKAWYVVVSWVWYKWIDSICFYYICTFCVRSILCLSFFVGTELFKEVKYVFKQNSYDAIL